MRGDAGRILDWIIAVLSANQLYTVFHKVFCATSRGLPQTRKHWFLIALRTDALRRDYDWPEPVEMIPLSAILGPRAHGCTHERRPGPATSLATRNVAVGVQCLRDWHVNFADIDYIMDCNTWEAWRSSPKQVCPCLTRSRPKGLLNVCRGEFLSGAASLRLQGVCTTGLRLPPREEDMRNLAGNGISVIVVERVIRAGLIACGREPSSFPDRWTSGEAQCALIREAWDGTPPSPIVDRLPSFVARHFASGDSGLRATTAFGGFYTSYDRQGTPTIRADHRRS